MLIGKSQKESLVRSCAAMISFIAALMFASAVQAAGYAVDQDFGSPGQEGNFDRIITIAPDVKWVNVTRDEAIKFVDSASGKSFVWRFDTFANVFDLGRVAPTGFLGERHIDVYVGFNPRYNRGG